MEAETTVTRLTTEHGQPSPARWRLLVPHFGHVVRMFRREEVRVHYDPSLAARWDASVTRRIASLWDGKMRGIPKAAAPPVDRPKFRLAAAHATSREMVLDVGPAWYSDYIALRSSSSVLERAAREAEAAGRSAAEVFPNVVGNVALILTRDSRSVAIERSQQVAVYRGYLDLPGGHPEPDRVDLRRWRRLERADAIEYLICDEFFTSVVRETTEDLAIDSASLAPPLLLCIIENIENILKPEMVFVLRTDLTAEEIRRKTLEHIDDCPEITNVVVFNPFEPEDHLRRSRMTPIMEGTLSVFRHAATLSRALR